MLRGDGGGWRSNLRRWYAQMGDQAPDDAALDAAVEHVQVCGREGRFVAIAGALGGMGGEAATDALLYGVIGQLESATVFVKMVGPRAQVEPERGRFEAFCASLRQREQAK